MQMYTNMQIRLKKSNEKHSICGLKLLFVPLHSFDEQVFCVPMIVLPQRSLFSEKSFQNISKTFLRCPYLFLFLTFGVFRVFGMNGDVFVCHSKALFRTE